MLGLAVSSAWDAPLQAAHAPRALPCPGTATQQPLGCPLCARAEGAAHLAGAAGHGQPHSWAPCSPVLALPPPPLAGRLAGQRGCPWGGVGPIPGVEASASPPLSCPPSPSCAAWEWLLKASALSQSLLPSAHRATPQAALTPWPGAACQWAPAWPSLLCTSPTPPDTLQAPSVPPTCRGPLPLGRRQEVPSWLPRLPALQWQGLAALSDLPSLVLQGLATSVGELNASRAQGSSQSVNSLPSSPSTAPGPVASWAESFEALLQDRVGLAYFTEFLKKEFSAENVYFWQACERFQQIPATNAQQLAQDARRIYDEFLSSHAVSPVNIDRQAWIGEDVLATPTPDMFQLQQLQIFNLMKFDSYARFVKSPLYQACAKAESGGLPLPDLRPHPRSGSPPLDLDKKTKLKPGKSLPLGVEAAGSSASAARSPRRSFRKGERREPSWADGGDGMGLWRESQGSLNSSASLDLGFLSSSSTSLPSSGPSSRLEGPRQSLGGTEPMKYCCVYLPDGTASLAAVRPGLSVRDMLAGICEKRGFHLPDIKVYLVGNEQKALALDQESSVLSDKEVKLENRISFELEIASVGKSVRIMAKATKSLREALQPILGKYGLAVEPVKLRQEGEPNTLDLERPVSTVAGQKLILEAGAGGKAAGTSHASASSSHLGSEESSPGDAEAELLLEVPAGLPRSRAMAAKNLNRRTYDLEGLVELLNRVQSCRANDQRGLLSKENLVLPAFLQLPAPAPTDSPCPAEPGPEPASRPERR
ncbi:regulator of G-protein signaling 14 isoform X1 [Alligator mississippiensis]|uniref:regulator of G-protein signaling 14 isoform X1 n=1 Tax=Alligator mississippiensis TaxID=8496 RepID=UPI00287762B4|nr:regulator of G-protein signaling 14 isoform X1 [Alligator mississippiensis]